MSKKVTRLYTLFQPEHYDLKLSINHDDLSFSGAVTIHGKKTGRPSKRLTFHQKDLNVTSAKILWHHKGTSQEIAVERINLHKSFQEVRLHTNQLLYGGSYTIEMEFSGKITDVMQGIYPSRFMHEDKEKLIIATQFESHHARRAFPCIDEPEAKATFDLTLSTEPGHTVLSNMPTKSQQNTDNNKVITEFETTPKMSTYLLAFATGPMHCAEGKTKTGIDVRSWASLARNKKELEYSVKEAIKILEFFADYFGVDYPLSKCDQVALPDFDAGAMENWGLITYREIALLTDPDNRSVSNEQYVSLVVAHELSHQWFGNLVTMKWWDDLWLNESFASVMEHLALDAIHPDWQQWETYVSMDVISTTNRDIYKDIQPVGVKVTDPDLIETLFDPGIVYAKGGRLIKMLRDYIGDEAFRRGLHNYFKKHAYDNTSREDLWQALSAASKQDISSLMTPWIEQPGMPIVAVKTNDTKLELSQKRYVLDSTDDPSIWPIPLLPNQKLDIELLQEQSTTVKVKSTDIILNQNASGHFFTYYKNSFHREKIAKHLANKTVNAQARINILNDSLMLARLGTASLTDALELVKQMSDEDRDNVWALISRIVGTAAQLTEGDQETEKHIKQCKVSLASPLYQRLGWDDAPDDEPNTKQLRHTAIALMLGGEDQGAIDEALNRYNSAKLEDIHAELRGSILGTAVRHGDSKIVSELTKAYQLASPDLQHDITSALTSTKKADVAQHVIAEALGEKGFVRPQDIMRWVALFLRNRHTRTTIWDYIVKNWGWLEQTLGESKSYDFIPIYFSSVVTTPELEQKYHQLFEPLLDNKTLRHNIEIGFSDIKSRVAWRRRDEAKIKDFFKNQSIK